MAFKKSNPSYSATLLKHAKSVYTFADKHRATYTTEISDAAGYYRSFSGFGDELAWAAAWLLRATNDSHYKSEAEKHFNEFGAQLNGKAVQFGWDDKTAGVQILMAEVTGEEKYKTMAKTFCDWVVHSAPKSPKGPNPHILTGAMVGGPDQNDNYSDKRDDYVHNEVAMDYNAGLQSALAALLQLKK
ncbi:unnamed protein product [Sphagnum tenellum]